MKNIKFKERHEIAVDPFSYDEKLGGNTALGFTNNSALFRVEQGNNFVEKNTTLINILKQVFLFFPATFIFFHMFFAVTVLFITSTNNGYQPYQWRFFVALSCGVLAIWFGLGDIRKVKHLALPISVILITLGMALITCLSETLVQWMFIEANAFIFFPLVLITPFLVKGLVDKLDEKQLANE